MPQPTASQLHNFLRSRRSIRRFRDEAVPDDLLERILETATWAPNAHNAQSWRFVRLANTANREAFAKAMADEYSLALQADDLPVKEIQQRIQRSRRRILASPEIILICVDMDSLLGKYGDPNRSEGEVQMAVQSAALAAGQLLLAAHAEGLAAVWICWPLFAPLQVSRALDIPESWQAQGMILIGYPAGDPPASSRRPLSDVLLTR